MTGRRGLGLVRSRRREGLVGGGVRRAPAVCLFAGSPGGDRVGAALARALRTHSPGVLLSGSGGTEMAASGIAPLFPMRPPSLAWPIPLLAFLPTVARRAARIERAVAAAEPDVLVTIDSPGPALAVARRVRRRRPDLPIVHYGVPPSWAVRPRRVRRLGAVVDHILVELPGEGALLEAAGSSSYFVGHPVAEKPPVAPSTAARYRAELGLRPGAPLLLLAPGARRGDVRRLLGLFRRAVDALARELPGLSVIVPLACTRPFQVERRLRGLGVPLHLVRADAGERQVRLAMAAADIALTAPGPVMLELAAAGTPMVACYRASPIARVFMRGRLEARTANLINILSGVDIVPEFFLERARPELVVPAVRKLLGDGDARTRQVAALEAIAVRLGRDGEPPSARAARRVLHFADRGRTARAAARRP